MKLKRDDLSGRERMLYTLVGEVISTYGRSFSDESIIKVLEASLSDTEAVLNLTPKEQLEFVVEQQERYEGPEKSFGA